MSDTEYTPRRKVIVEKYCEYNRLNMLNFLRDIKNKLIRNQRYEEAATLRNAESIIELDYNLFEEYILFVKNTKYYE